MGLITMTEIELKRLKVIQDLISRNITPRHAARLLHITMRQVRGLRRRFVHFGPAGLASRRRGKPSNRTTPAHIRNQVLEILRTRYADFGPTFACQKLREKHEVCFSPGTIRAWMKEDGL
jgi:homeodomain-containing protein